MNTVPYCGKRKIHLLEWVCIFAIAALVIMGAIWSAQQIDRIYAARSNGTAPRIVMAWEEGV